MDYCFSILCNVLWTIVLVFCVMFYGLLFFCILCNVLWTIVLVFCAMCYGLLF